MTPQQQALTQATRKFGRSCRIMMAEPEGEHQHD